MLNTKLSGVFLLVVYMKSMGCDRLPDSIQKCHEGDAECIAIACNHILHNKTNDFKILSLDPFHIPILRLKPDLNRPVNVDLNITNIDMYGLHTFNVYKISFKEKGVLENEGITVKWKGVLLKAYNYDHTGGFTQNISGVNEIHLKGNRLDLIGKYALNGHILIIPVIGKGVANVTIINPDIQLKFTGLPSMREGQTYMQTEDMKVMFSVNKLIYQFDNLYNGDKLLGDTTNRFINEYWRDIYLEIKPALIMTFEEQIQRIANNAMAKLPFDDYFLK